MTDYIELETLFSYAEEGQLTNYRAMGGREFCIATFDLAGKPYWCVHGSGVNAVLLPDGHEGLPDGDDPEERTKAVKRVSEALGGQPRASNDQSKTLSSILPHRMATERDNFQEDLREIRDRIGMLEERYALLSRRVDRLGKA